MPILYIIPNLLGGDDADMVIPAGVQQVVRGLHHFMVEENKSAHKLLKLCGVPTPFRDITLYPCDKHTPEAGLRQIFNLCAGEDIGLLSEAGYPAIADPGAGAVQAGREMGYDIRPLSGPSSIPMALAASGFNGQEFSFHGYLPADARAREQTLRAICRETADTGYTQLWIEAPYRNEAMLESILRVCPPELLLSLAIDITLPTEEIITKTIKEWRSAQPDIMRRPCVFSVCAVKPLYADNERKKPKYKRK